MSHMSVCQSVVVDVPVTLRVAVSVPEGQPDDIGQAARQLASAAVESFGHVSHDRIRAFNEVNRVHSVVPGQVETVECLPVVE
jgi:hypothetical protein